PAFRQIGGLVRAKLIALRLLTCNFVSAVEIGSREKKQHRNGTNDSHSVRTSVAREMKGEKYSFCRRFLLCQGRQGFAKKSIERLAGAIAEPRHGLFSQSPVVAKVNQGGKHILLKRRSRRRCGHAKRFQFVPQL